MKQDLALFLRVFKIWQKVYLTRVERFNTAHKLWVKNWTDEEKHQHVW